MKQLNYICESRCKNEEAAGRSLAQKPQQFWNLLNISFVEGTDLGKINISAHRDLPLQDVRSQSCRKKEPSVKEGLQRNFMEVQWLGLCTSKQGT